MASSFARLGTCALVVLALAGCESSKSANPLSPTVAGPIPGVNITAPKPLEPGQGWQVQADKQPITLLLENASSNGVRPLSYLFEIASDGPGFGVDEPMDKLGEKLVLPPFLEGRRAEIEAGLKPL